MKKDIDIVFVILHYMTDGDTIECIESIKRFIDTANYRIVVVDNASGNGSFDRLQNSYLKAEKIVLIENQENLGFARGLNVGIAYARSNWNTRFIAAINNDTMLLKNAFWEIIQRKFEQYHFAVMGPMIMTKDGRLNVNPIRNTIRSKKEVKSSINRYKRIMGLCQCHLYFIYRYINALKNKNDQKKISKVHLSEQLDYKLHGSFWIFSELYFAKFNEIDPATFLYGEEDILYLHLMKNGLHTLYCPEIKIYHKEDAATNELLPKNTDRIRFVSTHCIQSLETYIRIFESYEQGKI